MMNNTKPKVSLYIVFLLAIIVFASCSENREADELYDKVNSVIEESPDSALAMLDSISGQIDMNDEGIRNHYNLLSVKAADKAYKVHESDSLILSVLPYFEKHPQHLAEAYYYAGRVNSDIGDAPVALDYFEKALDVLPDKLLQENVLKQKSLIYSQLGALTFRQSLPYDSRKYYLEAYKIDTQLKDSANIIYDLLDLAKTYRETNDNDSLLSYLDKAEALSDACLNQELKVEVWMQKSLLYYNLKQYESALRHYNKAIDASKSYNVSLFSLGALIYTVTGEKDKAVEYWNKTASEGSVGAKAEAFGALANIYKDSGDIEKSIHYINLCMDYRDSVYTSKQIETISNLQHIYNYYNKEKEISRLKSNKVKQNYVIFGLTSATVIILLILALTIRRYKMKQLKSDLQLARYRHLEEKLSSTKVVDEGIGYIHEAVIDEQIVDLLELRLKESKIITSVDWSIIEKELNNAFPNFIKSLKELRTLNETDMQICMLLKIKYTPANIAKLIGKEKSTITIARKRMYKKTFGREGHTTDWDFFIHSL